jgi:hypothetical protein
MRRKQARGMSDVGRSSVFAWFAGLCAVAACTTVSRPSVESRPAPSIEACTLVEAPRSGEPMHTARIAFIASGLTRDVCALRLVSLALRPRFSSSHAHWTMQVVLDDVGATARPLGRDEARDLLDTTRALVATEDLALVAYVAARPELAVVPLPWDRTYVHVSHGGNAPLGTESFADAVRVAARPAEWAFCDTIFTDHTPEPERSLRVVYEKGDLTARDLAERVVALRSGSAVALEHADLETALRMGNERAYILSVPRAAGHACEVQTALRARAEWIATGSFVPLVDTRAYAIMPRNAAP